jgi:hypothetical protein
MGLSLSLGPLTGTVCCVPEKVTLDDQDPDAELLRLSPYSVTLPASFGGTVIDPELPYLVHLSLAYDGDRVRCTELTCRQLSDGSPVTSEGMTNIRVAELTFVVAREAVAELSHFTTAEGKSVDVARAVEIPPSPRGREGPSHEHLRALGVIYTTAYACGGSPRKAVMEQMNLSRTTANRWIRLARQEGLLSAGGGDDGEH